MSTQTAKSPNTAAITALALAAHRGLSQGDDSQFNRLIERLNDHRSQFINSSVNKYPSLDRCDLESLYFEAIWNECRRYFSADKGAFLRALNRCLTSRTYDLLESNKFVRKDEKTDKYENLLDSLDAKVETKGDAALPFEGSEETLFILRQTYDEKIGNIGHIDPRMDADKRALLKTKHELGLSTNEAVNIAGGIYRNRQQMWRDEQRHESRIKRVVR